VDVHEMPPNGQGITALIALNIIEQFDIKGMDLLGPQRLHVMTEALRLAFHDSKAFVSDPDFAKDFPMEQLLSKEYAKTRAALISPDGQALSDPSAGSPSNSSCTTYFTVMDHDGNACSFIQSNYMGFGTGYVPKGCGFTLQNRGCNFSTDRGHPNVVEPSKRPFHTIIPGMATKDGELFCAFGNMGGFMQPQGHLQLMSNMIDHGMDPQQAIEFPRLCIESAKDERGAADDVDVNIESWFPDATVEALKQKGHAVRVRALPERGLFGRAQIVGPCPKTGGASRWAGTENRCDGTAACTRKAKK